MDTRLAPLVPARGFSEAALFELVRATLRDLHPNEPAGVEVTLASVLDRDLGFDSLGRVELLQRVEQAAGVAPHRNPQRAKVSVHKNTFFLKPRS